jgi:hypothetical protein
VVLDDVAAGADAGAAEVGVAGVELATGSGVVHPISTALKVRATIMVSFFISSPSIASRGTLGR